MNKDIFCKGYTWGFFSKRGDFQTEAAEKSMERLASNGLNWICIPVNALQESFASTRVFSDYERTQSVGLLVHSCHFTACAEHFTAELFCKLCIVEHKSCV